MSKRQRRHSFPYELRAAEAAAAQRAVHTTFAQVRRRDDPDDPATAAWLAAIARFRAAVPAAYPPGFWEDVARLAKGDPEGLETAIRFLEADPYFDRSGYVTADLIRLVTRLPLDADESMRLRKSQSTPSTGGAGASSAPIAGSRAASTGRSCARRLRRGS